MDEETLDQSQLEQEAPVEETIVKETPVEASADEEQHEAAPVDERQKGVDKRIGKMAAQMWQERRRREDLERIAQAQGEELRRYREQLPQFAQQALDHRRKHLEAEVAGLSRDLTDPTVTADPARVAEAFQRLTASQAQLAQLANEKVPAMDPPRDLRLALEANGHLYGTAEQFAQQGGAFLDRIGATTNKEIAAAVGNIAGQVDREFINSGKKIGSPEYFWRIEDGLRNAKLGQGMQETTRTAAKPNGAAPSVVAPATRGPSGASAQKQGELTPGQKAAARRLGVTEEDYKKYL